MGRQVKQGDGWRIGWDDAAETYKGLVGGDRWAVELTEVELGDFCRLLVQLDTTIHQLANELMSDEKISCEVESEHIWLQADGYADAYELYLMVLAGRRAEGFWPAAVVPPLIHAAQMLRVF